MKKNVEKNSLLPLSMARSTKVPEIRFIYFLTMSKNLIFLSYRINYFKTSAIDTTFSQKFQQNLGDNLLKVGKKIMY